MIAEVLGLLRRSIQGELIATHDDVVDSWEFFLRRLMQTGRLGNPVALQCLPGVVRCSEVRNGGTGTNCGQIVSRDIGK